MTPAAPISIVVPVHNGRRFLPAVIDALLHECQPHPCEIVVVDDASTDGSRRYLDERARAGVLRVIDGPGRGAAAAVNAGIRDARHALICQVDQDVVVQPGWLAPLLEALQAPDVAAAQGRYVAGPSAGVWARIMALDLTRRYDRIRGTQVDHVCTGNTVYRASALHQVGLLDESLGYGYDNDLSYRLTRAGYRLAFCRNALSIHHWREDLSGHLWQQFGVGYGRLDVVARHPSRAAGDDVSGLPMIVHAACMLLACGVVILAPIGWLAGFAGGPALAGAAAIVSGLALERASAGVRVWRATRDPAALAFPVAHLLRDLTWAAAIVTWVVRRLSRARQSPSHSMRRMPVHSARPAADAAAWMARHRTLALVPAFNESSSLARVVADIRLRAPHLDILVVNDGSTDGTQELLPALGVRWITMPERAGVGSAIRAGLRYAARHGYEHVARVDGDGQHRACDIARLVSAFGGTRIDAVMGSRYVGRRARPTLKRIMQKVLAGCLTSLTGRRITDPTSGFWLFGPRAIRLLSRHHPTGYPEPELVLLLHRNRLSIAEVPIRMRPRRSGRTSLTPSRTGLALFRTMMALMIVPLRDAERDGGGAHD